MAGDAQWQPLMFFAILEKNRDPTVKGV